MRGGVVSVVDLDSARVVARVTDQGATPQVAWLSRKDQSPLLVVATGKELNAFEVTPTDLEKSDKAAADDKAAEGGAPPAAEKPAAEEAKQ
jgi:hypothetical protein